MKNPRHGLNPWDALYHVPADAQSIVDIGCNVGELLDHAHHLGVSKLYGIDINPEAAETACRRLAHVDTAKIVHGSADELPFEDQSADVGVCSEVLEHIPAELRRGAIEEAHRVLKPGAPLIVTVPYRGLFALLDPANWRARLPAVYKIVNRVVGGAGREEALKNQKHGVVWHHHFTLDELRKLMDPLFEIETIRFRGAALAPICEWAAFPLYRAGMSETGVFRMLKAIQDFDYSVSYAGAFAYNVLIVVRRR